MKCKECPGGQYQDVMGQTKCKECAKGEYQDVMGQTTCIDCPKGYYAPRRSTTMESLTGQVKCTACELGFYQPDKKQRHCLIIKTENDYVTMTADDIAALHTACEKHCWNRASCNKCTLNPIFVHKVKNSRKHEQFEKLNLPQQYRDKINKIAWSPKLYKSNGIELLKMTRSWSHFASIDNPFIRFISANAAVDGFNNQETTEWAFVPNGAVNGTFDGEMITNIFKDGKYSYSDYHNVCPIWKPSFGSYLEGSFNAGHWYNFYDPTGDDNEILQNDTMIYRGFKGTITGETWFDYDGFVQKEKTSDSDTRKRFVWRTMSSNKCRMCPKGKYASLNPLPGENHSARKDEFTKAVNDCDAPQYELRYGKTPCVACQPGFFLDTKGNWGISQFPYGDTVKGEWGAYGYHNLNGAGDDLRQYPSKPATPGRLKSQKLGQCGENLLFNNVNVKREKDDTRTNNFRTWGAQPVLINTGSGRQTDYSQNEMEWYPEGIFHRHPSFADAADDAPRVGACRACPIGFYQDKYGASDCKQCKMVVGASKIIDTTTKHYGEPGEWMAQTGSWGCFNNAFTRSLFGLNLMDIINPGICTGKEKGFAKITCKMFIDPLTSLMVHLVALPVMVANIALAELIPSKIEGATKDDEDSLYGKGIAERFCLLMYGAANKSPVMAGFLSALMDFTPQGVAIGQKYLSKLGTSAEPIQELYKICEVPGGGKAKKAFCAVRPQLNWVTSQDWWYGRGYDVIEDVDTTLRNLFAEPDKWLHNTAIKAANPDKNNYGRKACDSCGITVIPGGDSDTTRYGSTLEQKKRFYFCTRHKNCDPEYCIASDGEPPCRAKNVDYDTVVQGFPEIHGADVPFKVFSDISLYDPTCGGDYDYFAFHDASFNVKSDLTNIYAVEVNDKINAFCDDYTGVGRLLCEDPESWATANGDVGDRKPARWILRSNPVKGLWYDKDADSTLREDRVFDLPGLACEGKKYCEPYKTTDRLALVAARLNWNMDTKFSIKRRRKVMKCGRDAVNAGEVGSKPSRKHSKLKGPKPKPTPKRSFVEKLKSVGKAIGRAGSKSKVQGLANMMGPVASVSSSFDSQQKTAAFCEKRCHSGQWFGNKCIEHCLTTGGVCDDKSGRNATNCVKEYSITITKCMNDNDGDKALHSIGCDIINDIVVDPSADFLNGDGLPTCVGDFSITQVETCTLKASKYDYFCADQSTSCRKVLSLDNARSTNFGEYDGSTKLAEDVASGLRGAVADNFGKGSSYLFLKWWPNHDDARLASHEQNRFYFDSSAQAGVGFRYSTSTNNNAEEEDNIDGAFDGTNVEYGNALKTAPEFLYHQFSFGFSQNLKGKFKQQTRCLKGIVKALNTVINMVTTDRGSMAASADKGAIQDLIMPILTGGLACSTHKNDLKKKKEKKEKEEQKKIKEDAKNPKKQTPKQKKAKKSLLKRFSSMISNSEPEISLTLGLQHNRCFAWLLDPRGGIVDGAETWIPKFEKFNTCTGEKLGAAASDYD